MQTIKIYFSDFHKGFDYQNNFITKIIQSLGLNVELDTSPDFLFYSSQGKEHLKFTNCVKIYFTGENDVPNFNNCDYAISFHNLNFGDRHLRFPLYLLPGNCYETIKRNNPVLPELANRRFCNFVYSNSKLADPYRDCFFKELSKYKKIDSGGRLMNNIGGPVSDKSAFIKDYKFTIAFENSSIKGYTTEKIIEPMAVNSMPIYWGNPDVNHDFNEESFIWIKDRSKTKEMIDLIVYLDENDESYLNKLSQPWLTTEQAGKDWDSIFSAFLYNIITQGFPLSKRTTDYGYAKLLRDREVSLKKKILALFK